MKIRITIEGAFRGAFSDEFIAEYWNSEINGSLVSEWILIQADSPSENFIDPIWDFDLLVWKEGASVEQVNAFKQIKIDELSAFYRNEINNIVLPYLPDLVIENIPLPANIESQRIALKDECVLKIQEIDPSGEMSKPGDNQPINFLEKKS